MWYLSNPSKNNMLLRGWIKDQDHWTGSWSYSNRKPCFLKSFTALSNIFSVAADNVCWWMPSVSSASIRPLSSDMLRLNLSQSSIGSRTSSAWCCSSAEKIEGCSKRWDKDTRLMLTVEIQLNRNPVGFWCACGDNRCQVICKHVI